ncbi:NTP transferase domain-containing protein [Runella slithyformis]|uniref:Probable molybdenum cofactor guanylyltransferase n=1 Tax=Runella slithyformis (strain ATCC 29530 / DSM 19594 / LMG 11500 / NCIMB 11436 / LSU 4) TaxID=761193 RepID=A0A7U3ZK14_RUNSL|nr:NTP transferase domain-containing protein [Runella slithyformis]AEI48577.1 Molybdopterin-guanine dinucleotide biosynthesis protein A [Runella slithyformis DSM 19594]
MNGLILVGGRSTRMGTDKSQLAYRHQPQWRYLYELLTPYCQSVFLSCRKDQEESFEGFPRLTDTREIGPLGGLLTAFAHAPHEAWLTVACDMPFIDEETIDLLVKNRQPAQRATAFLNPETRRPEPLLAIWEPESYELIRAQFQQNNFSPLHLMQKGDVHLLPCPRPRWLQNINTPEEWATAVAK